MRASYEPTFGEARRKLKRIDEAFDRWTDYYNRWRADFIGKIIEADRARGDIS